MTSTSSCETRRELDVRGTKVVVFERGAGEPCLLLHGYPQDHRTWRRVAPALAESHRVIAVDWPNWGESVGGEPASALYDEEAARLAWILDALGIPRANVLAHDYGGHLALGFAARNADRLLRLAILNSRAHATFPMRWYLQFSAMERMARTPPLDRLLAAIPLYALHRRSLARYVRNGSFGQAGLESYIGWMRTAEGRGRFVSFFRDYQTAVRAGMREECASIAVPTAVIYGDADPYCPWSVAEDLACVVPGATLVRIADGDHYIMEERPAEVLAALRELLVRPVSAGPRT